MSCKKQTMNNPPLCYRKQRRAQNKDDFETWIETQTANILNTFDNGDVRSTTLVVEIKERVKQ